VKSIVLRDDEDITSPCYCCSFESLPFRCYLSDEFTIPTLRSITNQAGKNSGLIYFHLNACRLVKERNQAAACRREK
jgi:hypothetical protein